MKYSKIFKIELIISYIMSAIVTVQVLLSGGLSRPAYFEFLPNVCISPAIQAILFFCIVGIIFFFVINFAIIPISIIKIIFLTKNVVDKKYVDTKESIYTRDLPEYNSAMAGEILDFKTAIDYEYVAGLIELISKGYIIEEENGFVINDEKNIDDLFLNEKYILKTCTKVKSNLNLLNEYAFKNIIKEDLKRLGLYEKQSGFEKIIDCIKKSNLMKSGIFVISMSVISLILIFLIFISLTVHFLLTFLPIILLYLILIIVLRKNKLTDKGELEKEKIAKLKLFLEKETNFKDKVKTERKVWGRYSAFAVAFGQNEEMKDEIFEKLIGR